MAAFFAVIAITNKTDTDMIDDFAGMGRRAPTWRRRLPWPWRPSLGFLHQGFFIAKLYIFSAAVHSDLAWLAMVGVVNSVVSAYYYLRVVRTMYVTPPTTEEKVPSSHAFRIALAVTALAVLGLGIYPAPLLQVAEEAVGPLLQMAGTVVGTP